MTTFPTTTRAVAAAVALACTAGMAIADDDRPLTTDEVASLRAAVTAEGCTGGEPERDDDGYEVDNATCADGKRYDLDFDNEFKLTDKDLDD